MITANLLEALMYDLPLLVAASRGRRGVSLHSVAIAVGVSPSTLHRLEGGYPCDVRTVINVLRWIESE